MNFKLRFIYCFQFVTKKILCSLQAMFTGGLKECEMTRVKLQGVCPTAMARLMSFMYTGKIRVTELTVCSLLPAATMFQVGFKNFISLHFNFFSKIKINCYSHY